MAYKPNKKSLAKKINEASKKIAKDPLKALSESILDASANVLLGPKSKKSSIGHIADGTFLYPNAEPNFNTNDSSWVAAYGYLYLNKTHGMGLAVEFLDGFQAFYPGTTIDQYRSMRQAKSKGKWIWANVYYSPYIALN